MRPFEVETEKLTAPVRAAIDEILCAHHYDGTDLIAVLLEVEAAMERRYISRPVAYYVADRLGLKPTQVFDVISFYTALHDKPRAKFPLQICDSAPCRVCGSESLYDMLRAVLGIDLGEVTYDGRFTIEKVPCFGACDVAPAVRVNGVVYGNLTDRERVLAMLRQLD